MWKVERRDYIQATMAGSGFDIYVSVEALNSIDVLRIFSCWMGVYAVLLNELSLYPYAQRRIYNSTSRGCGMLCKLPSVVAP